MVRVPDSLPMDAAAPLLCAGITVYCPMKDHNLLEPDSAARKIGVVGLGGLGHVAVKFAKAFGHHVTVISTSPSKEKEAKVRLGADDFLLSTDAKLMQVCLLALLLISGDCPALGVPVKKLQHLPSLFLLVLMNILYH